MQLNLDIFFTHAILQFYFTLPKALVINSQREENYAYPLNFKPICYCNLKISFFWPKKPQNKSFAERV